MTEELIPVDLGFHTIDVDIYENRCTDWHTYQIIFNDFSGDIITVTFRNVLAFSFGYMPYLPIYSSCETYLVKDSAWLMEQTSRFLENYQSDDISEVVHYKLCFNKDDEELNLICNKTVEVLRESGDDHYRNHLSG